MKDNILKLLNEIEMFNNNFGDSIYKKPNEDDIISCSNWMKKNNASDELIDGYLDLMNLTNGMEYNGLIIYSTLKNDKNSIYEANEIWWDIYENKDYIFFADDSISLFCYNKLKNNYSILDKGCADLIEEFHKFDDILFEALSSVID